MSSAVSPASAIAARAAMAVSSTDRVAGGDDRRDPMPLWQRVLKVLPHRRQPAEERYVDVIVHGKDDLDLHIGVDLVDGAANDVVVIASLLARSIDWAMT